MLKHVFRGAFAALVVTCLFTAACGGSTCGNCNTGNNYCRDPGGHGPDLCCPVSTPYYCGTDNLCHGSVFFSCPSGKIFCSVEWTCK
jgi:hypothetical protein